MLRSIHVTNIKNHIKLIKLRVCIELRSNQEEKENKKKLLKIVHIIICYEIIYFI